MAVSVNKRPSHYYFDTANVVTATTANNSGKVNISKTSHGLSNGAVVYVKSDVEDYNGFFFVRTADANLFYIQTTNIPYSGNTSDCVNYISAASALSYYGVAGSTISWNCIHLPIIYRLTNTLWPTNSADTVRTISSVTDSSGYCAIVASADIKATGSAAALEFVKITGATDDDLNGVWQITAYTNETTFTVDIPYSAANDTALTSASIQYYYNNYHIKVQVWGGLDNGHPYYAQEPYELLATLSLIPDEDGICMFSIHEILKKNVAVKNNLLLGTLPNNLDAFTKFFIKYCEVYDDSDGTTLSTLAESYTSDLATFEGIAVNAALPFKNVYSGALSEYASENSSQKFLTPWARPSMFSGEYFDLSLLWDGVSDIYFKQEWYLNDVLQTTTYSDYFDGFYTGVYRGSITPNCSYDRVDVTAYKTIGISPPTVWVAEASTFDTITATTFTEAVTTATVFTNYYSQFALAPGEVVTIDLGLTITGTWTCLSLGIELTVLVRNSGGVIDISDTFHAANTNETRTITLTGSGSTSTRLYIGVSNWDLNSGTANVTITVPSRAKVAASAYQISETKTIDINCDCVPTKATGYYLSWLNYLGGFDYWYFTGYADHIIDITDSGETETNTFPDWPDSYGEFGDTIRKHTHKTSRRQKVVRSQNLTLAQLQAIEYIKTSPLVQIVESIYDRRTVLVDSDSFTSYKEGQKELYTISFTITYTDDVPSQRV